MMARLFVCGGLGIWMMGTLAVAGRTFRPSPHGRPEPEPARCSNGKVRLLRETDLVCPQCSISLPCIDVNVQIKTNPCRAQRSRGQTNYVIVHLFHEQPKAQFCIEKQCSVKSSNDRPLLKLPVHFERLDRNGQTVTINVYSLEDHVIKMLYDDAIKAGYFHLDCEESDETGETETTPRPVVTQTRETETTPRPVVTQTRETETRGGSQTTQSGIETRLSSHKPDTQPEDGDSMVPYAVGIVFVLLVLLSLGIFIYCLRKRRSDEENSFQQPTQLSTLPTSQYEDVTPLDDDDRNGASRDYHVTRGDHSPVGVQTGSGSDDDQYGRLDRNGRKPNGAVGHSDVYGHATSPQPATSEGAEESASQQENDVYNQLRRYRKKQIVMDNVYDSTR